MDRSAVLKDLILQYREKIRLYEAMVAELERECGATSDGGVLAPSNGGEGRSKSSDPVANVRQFQFFNKSQPEAAKTLLEFVKHPLLTQQIVDGIEKGGVAVGGKSAKDKKLNLYSILNRNADFVRWEKDTWGLPHWQGAPKRETEEEENGGGKEESGKRKQQRDKAEKKATEVA
jgi:hypothetical protein